MLRAYLDSIQDWLITVKASKIKFGRYRVLCLLLVLLLPHMLIRWFDYWQLRLCLGLILSLCGVLVFVVPFSNPKFKFLTFDPKDYPKREKTLRSVEIAVRATMILIGIMCFIKISMPIAKGGLAVLLDGNKFVKVTGRVKDTSTVVPAAFFQRDCRLESHNETIDFLFPGKNHIRSGSTYTFYLLPNTSYAVDIKRAEDQQNQDTNYP